MGPRGGVVTQRSAKQRTLRASSAQILNLAAVSRQNPPKLPLTLLQNFEFQNSLTPPYASPVQCGARSAFVLRRGRVSRCVWHSLHRLWIGAPTARGLGRR